MHSLHQHIKMSIVLMVDGHSAVMLAVALTHCTAEENNSG